MGAVESMSCCSDRTCCTDEPRDTDREKPVSISSRSKGVCVCVCVCVMGGGVCSLDFHDADTIFIMRQCDYTSATGEGDARHPDPFQQCFL